MATGFIRAGVQAACALIIVSGTGFAAEAAGKVKAPAPKAPAVTAYTSSKSPVAAEPEATGAVAPASDDNCTKQRRRLWVEGEGWVVRRVTTCY